MRRVGGGRYYVRTASKIVKKKRALKLIKRRAEYQQLLKEGKVAEPAPRRGYNRDSSSGTPRPAEGAPIAR